MSFHDRFSNDTETAAALAYDETYGEDRPDPSEYEDNPYGERANFRSTGRSDVFVDPADFIPAGSPPVNPADLPF